MKSSVLFKCCPCHEWENRSHFIRIGWGKLDIQINGVFGGLRLLKSKKIYLVLQQAKCRQIHESVRTLRIQNLEFKSMFSGKILSPKLMRLNSCFKFDGRFPLPCTAVDDISGASEKVAISSVIEVAVTSSSSANIPLSRSI